MIHDWGTGVKTNALLSDAADKFTDEIRRLTETLKRNPMMYQVYEDDTYFRSMLLSYRYRLFYHVVEETETVRVHRVIHGMRELDKALYD